MQPLQHRKVMWKLLKSTCVGAVGMKHFFKDRREQQMRH